MRRIRLLFSALALVVGVWAQHVQTVMPVPDCQLYFALTAGSLTSASFSNRTVGCTTWTIAYSYTGYTALTLTVQAAPDAAGGIPGAWAIFGGTVLAGVNPNVVVASVPTQGSTVLSGYYPWMRVLLAGTAGAGTVRGVMYGYKSRTVTALLVGLGGGSAVFCPFRAVVSTVGAGTAEIIGAVGAGLSIRICHLSLGMSVPSNVTLVSGTGLNCVAGPTNLSGPYQNLTALALDFGNSPLILPAATAFCINQSAAATAGGLMIYAVF